MKLKKKNIMSMFFLFSLALVSANNLKETNNLFNYKLISYADTNNENSSNKTIRVIRQLKDGTVIRTENISKKIGERYKVDVNLANTDTKLFNDNGELYSFEKDGQKYIFLKKANDSGELEGIIKENNEDVKLIYERLEDTRRITIHRNIEGEADEVIHFRLPKDLPIWGISPFRSDDEGFKEYKTSRDWFWFFKVNFDVEPDSVKNQYKKTDGTYDRNKYADEKAYSFMGRDMKIFGFKLPLSRTYGFNTRADGTGTYYKMGTKLPEDAPMDLELYIMNADSSKMNSIFTEIAKVKPEIYLENSLEHKSVETAYNVDKSMSLHYKAKLDFENIRHTMAILWGRSDKIVAWHGYVRPVFDKRLKFDKDVEIAFESTWQQVDPLKQAELGAKNIRKEGNRTIFTFESRRMEDFKNADGDYEINIPVTLVPKEDFVKLSFEEFMKPMWLSVADNFDNGINAIIDDESYLKISTSDDPIIRVGGQINLTIKGDTGGFGGIRDFSNRDPKADLVYARLFPHGLLDVDFYEVGTDENGEFKEINKLKPIINITSDDGTIISTPSEAEGTPSEVVRYSGRSKHSAYENLDERNYANSFYVTETNDEIPNLEAENIRNPIMIKHPEIDGYTFVGVKATDSNGERIKGFGTFDYLYGHINSSEHGFNNINEIIPKQRRYYYIKNTSIIIDHTDRNGNKLTNTIYENGKKDEEYRTNDRGKITFGGKTYKYKRLATSSDAPNGRYKDHPQHIVYTYDLGGNVTSRYVILGTDNELLTLDLEPTMKEIKPKDTSIDEEYSISENEIPEILYDKDGNKYKYEKDREENGRFKDKPTYRRSGNVDALEKTIVFEYKPMFGEVLVKYVDENGEEIHKPKENVSRTHLNKVEKEYDTRENILETINYDNKEYKFKEISDEDIDKESGVLKEGTTVVTYVYELNKEEIPEKPIATPSVPEKATPSVPEKPSKPSEADGTPNKSTPSEPIDIPNKPVSTPSEAKATSSTPNKSTPSEPNKKIPDENNKIPSNPIPKPNENIPNNPIKEDIHPKNKENKKESEEKPKDSNKKTNIKNNQGKDINKGPGTTNNIVNIPNKNKNNNTNKETKEDLKTEVKENNNEKIKNSENITRKPVKTEDDLFNFLLGNGIIMLSSLGYRLRKKKK